MYATLAALTVVLLAGPGPADPVPAPPDFTDDFTANTLKGYHLAGEVAWHKGAVRLGKQASLSRKIAVGVTVEARATGRLTGQGRVNLVLRGPGADVRGEVFTKEKQLWVRLPGAARGEFALGPAESAWVLRLRVRHGLAELLAHRDGLPAPDRPLAVRWLGRLDWRPDTVAVESDTGDATLTALSLRGEAPPTPLPAERHKQLLDAVAGLGAMHKLAQAGRFTDALARGRESLALAEKALTPGSPLLAGALNNVALVAAQAAPDEARRYYDRALAIQRNTLPPEHPQIATCLHNLGTLLSGQGKVKEAQECLLQALAIKERVLSPDDADLASTLNGLGLLLLRQGRLDEARARLGRAVAICNKALPPLHPDRAAAMNNLGNVLFQLGKADEAQALHEEALAVRRKALPPGHPDLAQSLSALGGVLLTRDKLAEARGPLEEALAIRRKALPRDHPDLAESLSNLGLLLQRQGQAGAAATHLEEALGILEKRLAADDPRRAAVLTNLGVLLFMQGKTEEALARHEQAFQVNRQALPTPHPDTALSLTHLGLALYRAGRAAEGWARLAEAVGIQSQYLALVSAGTPERDHAALIGRKRHLLDAYLSATAALPSPPAAQRREAFLRLLEAKGVSTTALGARRDRYLQGADAEALALAGKLAPLRRRLADLLLHGPVGLGPGEYRRLCADLQRQADDLERELALRVKPLGDLRRAHEATAADLAARLRPGEVLVETVRYAPAAFDAARGRWLPSPPQYAAFLLWQPPDGAPPQPRYVPLGPAEPLESAISAWRAQVQKGRADGTTEKALRERLWVPLERGLPPGTNRLVVAPDGALALVPLEALRLDNGKYLVESHAVRYVNSARDLMPLAAPKERPNVAVILADPEYDHPAGGGKAPAAALHFRRLPGFAREADVAAKLLGGVPGWKVRTFREGEASEEALGKAGRPRLLYCVTHGFFLEDSPGAAGREAFRDLDLIAAGAARPRALPPVPDPRLRSGLALTGANRAKDRATHGQSDGLLTALEVQDLDLWGTELVILSACDTGRGEVQVGEGVLGLRRAFQLAGAQTVLASLWKVPDAETEQLMTDTLSRWLKGTPPHEALREAQLAMIRRLRAEAPRDAARGQAPPLYWAAFICHGHPR